jgi:hypothetical protein
MMKRIALLMVLSMAFCHAAFSQTLNSYTYVASETTVPNGAGGSYNEFQIYGYQVLSNGTFTPIVYTPTPARPFTGSLYMAVEGKFLFVSDSVTIYTYAIASNGNLSLVATADPTAYVNNSGGVLQPGW